MQPQGWTLQVKHLRRHWPMAPYRHNEYRNSGRGLLEQPKGRLVVRLLSQYLQCQCEQWPTELDKRSERMDQRRSMLEQPLGHLKVRPI